MLNQELRQLRARINMPGALPFDDDAPVVNELKKMGYLDLRQVVSTIDEESGLRLRARIRYLAALLPNIDRNLLASALHAIVNNRSVTISDMRLIVDGRSLADPTRRTHEPPIERIQTVGRMLQSGSTYRAAAEGAGVSVDLVESIDRYLGITQALDDRIMGYAVEAVREGESVRKFADREGLSKSTAHRYMQRARAVLVELGEVTA